MSKVGISENTSGQGLTHLEDPNSGAAATGAVDANGNVLPSEPSEAASPPPPIEIQIATLEPKVLPAARVAHSLLVVGSSGTVSGLGLKLQSRVGHRWRSVKTLGNRKLVSGTKTFPLNFGRLRPGKYRLLVTVSGPEGEGVTEVAPLTVRAKP